MGTCSPPTAMPSRERYRFFSYGDAMFVEPDPAALAPREAA